MLKKNIFYRIFFVLFAINIIIVPPAIVAKNKSEQDAKKSAILKKEKLQKKKSWREWFNEPIYKDVPVLKQLHEEICTIVEIDDLYKWLEQLPDDTYKTVAQATGKNTSIQRRIKRVSDPIANQLVGPLLDWLRKGYWARKAATETLAVCWQTTSWAKVFALYGCDLAYTTIAYPRKKVAWRFVKSLLLSDAYIKLYKKMVPDAIQKKSWLNFIFHAYAFAASSYALDKLNKAVT